MITFNPNDKSDNISLSNNNLTAKRLTGDGSVRATLGKSSGKWYWEIKYENGLFMAGVTSGSISLPTYIDREIDSTGYYSISKTINYSKSVVISTDTFAINDIMGIALDLDNRKISFYKNGISMSNATNLDLAVLQITASTLYPSVTVLNTDGQITANFGATPFKYEVPTGYSSYDCINKYLIQYNSNLYTYDGMNIIQSPSQTLDDFNFKTNGFSDVVLIPETTWKSTFTDLSQVKLLIWTEDLNKSELELIYNCNQFDMSQWLIDNQCNLLTWVDNTIRTKLDMVYNCDSYIIWDNVILGSKLLQFDGSNITTIQTKTGYRLLIQDGDRAESTDGVSINYSDPLPYITDEFNNNGLLNLSNMNKNIIQKLSNSKYKLALYKVK